MTSEEWIANIASEQDRKYAREAVNAALEKERVGEEPLAVLAARKGWWITCIRKRPIGWCINLDSKENYVDFPEEMVNTIHAPTYPEAEAKARQYLESLPDKEGK